MSMLLNGKWHFRALVEPSAKRWRVVSEDGKTERPFHAEAPARAYAAKHGGRVEEREAVAIAGGEVEMGAKAAAVVTTRQGRVRYDHYETVPSSAGPCPMCGAATVAHVPHACAKPDFDHPPHAVRARHKPLEWATFPFLIHPGLLWRFESRVWRCTNGTANYVQSREAFYAMVEAGMLEEVPYANE